MTGLLQNYRDIIMILFVSMIPASAIFSAYFPHQITNGIAEAGLFPWLEEFTYETDAPNEAKELANKTVEKRYTLYNHHYELLDTKIGAVVVKLHVKSKPLNEHETKIDFTAKAKYVYAKNGSFDIKKEKAQVSGYSILNSKTGKLSMHIPWAELLKNM